MSNEPSRMIVLSCPHCSSRFLASLAPEGETSILKCSSCGFVLPARQSSGKGVTDGDSRDTARLPRISAIVPKAHSRSDEDEFTAMGTSLDAKIHEDAAAASRQGVLIVGPTEDSVPLAKFKMTIGRVDADIVLDDVDVSRHHAVIERYDEKYLLKDLGSTNGTYLNGQRVSIEFLKDGDILRMGKTEIRFRLR